MQKAQSMNQPNVTAAARIENPVFDVGNDAAKRISDPTVAIVVTTNLFIRVGAQRSLSCNAPLHEVPLLRRLYAAIGGTVKPNTAWVPGIRRRAKLSHSQLQDELRRLSEKYVLPTEGGKRDIMGEVYGATGAERLKKLRDKMIEANEMWTALETAAMKQIRATGLVFHRLEAESLISERIDTKDVERLIRMLDPAEVAADEIELNAIAGADLLLDAPGAEGGDAKEAAPDPDARRMSPAEVFGDAGVADEEAGGGEKVEPLDPELEPADLTEADVLIANLRQDGIDAADANRVALIAAGSSGHDRADAIREAGFKGQALAKISKRLREYDTATAPAPVAKTR